MARYTAAYSSYISRQGEVESLQKLALHKERQNAVKNAREINALCRGAVVLLSSHVEAYTKEVGEIAIDSLHSKAIPRTTLSSQFFYHVSKQHLDEIRGTTDHGRIADKVFSFLADDQALWSQTGPFPAPLDSDRFNKGFSNPTFKKIQSYFNRFGYAQYRHDLAHLLTGNFLLATNMVDHMVDTRNKIAHGDPMATKTPREILQMMQIVRTFCAATDSVFGSWWKGKFCSIR